jgi:hypothetical protein
MKSLMKLFTGNKKIRYCTETRHIQTIEAT